MAFERVFEPRLVQVREHDSRPGEQIEGLPSRLAAKLGEHLRVGLLLVDPKRTYTPCSGPSARR
jgi:hypothetical protein